MRAGTVVAAATESQARTLSPRPVLLPRLCRLPGPSAVASSALRVPGCTLRARNPEEEQPELSLLLAPRGAECQEGAQPAGC